ncbi:MAG: phosphonate C-P lyase system protein PhnG [Eubacteriales bacterium]
MNLQRIINRLITNKRRLFKILTKKDRTIIMRTSEEIQMNYDVTVIKEPSKTLAMIEMREPVRQSLFYIGEVIVYEAIAELNGIKGTTVTVCDDREKMLHMAIIDATVNKGVFCGMDMLFTLEKEQHEIMEKENVLHLKTMVKFGSIDREVPDDVDAFIF